jgi:carboxypeptidase Q
MKRIVWLPVIFWGLSVQAQQDDSSILRRLADAVLSSGSAYESLRTLCKTVGPRLSGSPGIVKAEAWARQALQAAGAEKIWLQECQVPNWHRGREEAWYGSKDGKTLKKTALDILALGNSIGTDPKGVYAPAILINDFRELEKRKDEIAGKVVVFNNIFNPRNLATFKSYGESGAYRRSGPSQAARYGAKAVLIRSVTAATDNNPHTGSLMYDSAYPQIPAAAMGLKDADALIARLKAGEEVYIYYRSEAGFGEDVTAHNVVGEWKGAEFPDQYITVGGHLDSWDPAEGAQDDGAGCVH